MANPRRGEIDAKIDGKIYTLCLTLGALAELEAQLQASDLNGLAERFANGRIATRDLIAIIGAGLRGGGNPISNAELANMRIDGGAAGAAKIAVALLSATFSDELTA